MFKVGTLWAALAALHNLALRNLALRNLALRNPALHNLALRNLALRSLALRNLALRNPALHNLVLHSLVLRNPALRNLALRNLVLCSPVLQGLILPDRIRLVLVIPLVHPALRCLDLPFISALPAFGLHFLELCLLSLTLLLPLNSAKKMLRHCGMGL